jgi:hypothetical protein
MIEADHSAKRGKSLEEAGESRDLPRELDVLSAAWKQQEVEGSLSDDLVRDGSPVWRLCKLRLRGFNHAYSPDRLSLLASGA